VYTAVVLDIDSAKRLMDEVKEIVPSEWELLCHHMTINMGSFDSGPAGPAGFKLCQEVPLTVTTFAQDGKVMAVGVECPVPSNNERKHITVAVNRAAGGKPFHSNKLTDWTPVARFVLKGHIEECN
jgi:hypothetical protein